MNKKWQLGNRENPISTPFAEIREVKNKYTVGLDLRTEETERRQNNTGTHKQCGIAGNIIYFKTK